MNSHISFLFVQMHELHDIAKRFLISKRTLDVWQLTDKREIDREREYECVLPTLLRLNFSFLFLTIDHLMTTTSCQKKKCNNM